MDNIIETLAHYFSPKFREKLKRAKNIESLIAKLEKKELSLKEALLRNDLTQESRESKVTKLAVLLAQKEKAQILLDNAKENN